MSRILRALRLPALRVGLLLAILVIWQVMSDRGTRAQQSTWSSPRAVWEVMADWIADGTLWEALRSSLYVVIVGYTVGVVLGVAIGFVTGISAKAAYFAEPFLVFFNAVPRILLAPFLVVWLGFGAAPRMILVVLVVSLIAAITVQHGVRQLSADLINNATMLGANPVQLLGTVYLPGVGAWVLSSARSCVGYAIQVAIIAEFFGASEGLGSLVVLGFDTLRTAYVYAALVTIAIFAFAVDLFLARVERRALRWLPNARKT